MFRNSALCKERVRNHSFFIAKYGKMNIIIIENQQSVVKTLVIFKNSLFITKKSYVLNTIMKA
jgi:hypothetical protein